VRIGDWSFQPYSRRGQRRPRESLSSRTFDADGYLGGKVSKADLVSWIIVEFEKSSFEKSVEDIRKQSFDQLRYLESFVKLLKRSRKNGEAIPVFDLPADLVSLAAQ
jgi:hypothetical protein